ncbi:MAG: PAC2 family protein, partial [Thermoproteus sp.]
ILNDLVGRVGPDVAAALKLIDAVGKITGVQIDTSKLQEHAQKYAFLVEKNIEALMQPPQQRREIPLMI